MQFRNATFGRADVASRSVPVVISTEHPVDRGRYVEILDHSANGVDLARAPLPLIVQHNGNELNIGVVDELRLARGKLRGIARFGRSKRATEVLQEVVDEIVRSVSVGYEHLDEGTPVPHPSGRARKFRFQPYEVSAVSVPADPNAGFNRSHPSKGNTAMNFDRRNEHEDEDDLEHGNRPSRSQRRTAARDGSEDLSGRTDLRGYGEQQRVKDIEYLGARHNQQALAQEHVRIGTSLDSFRGLLLQRIDRSGAEKPLYQPAAEIGMTDREARSFSLTRLMLSQIEKRPDLAPFENEACDTARKGLARIGHPLQGGLCIPMDVLRAPVASDLGMARYFSQRTLSRDMSTGSVGAGGAMVATDVLEADFITLLRNRALVLAMGGRLLGGLVGNVSIPRQAGTVTVNWVAQGGGATESDASFSAVTLALKTAHAIQDVTRDLLLQGTPAVEGLVRADLLAAMAVAIDTAALHGTGASNQPTGLALTAGIGAVAGGTNGANPTWDHMVALETLVANSNGGEALSGYLTNSKVRGQLKKTQKFAGTNGQEVWAPAYPGDNPAAFGSLNGYRAGVSNNVRSDLPKGTASGICSAIFFGDWADLLIGQWGTAEILPDPFTQAANRIVRMHVYQSIDIGVRRPASFSAMLDALTP